LLDIEVEARTQNRIALRYRQSKLTEKPTIDQFVFDHHTSRKKHKGLILSLMDLDFMRNDSTRQTSAPARQTLKALLNPGSE